MLMKALYEFAKRAKGRHGAPLIDSLEFESRFIAWLVDIGSNGTFKGFIPLMSEGQPGTLFDKLPRTIEPKDSGTIAEFLVEDLAAILGLGESPSTSMKKKAYQKHEHFWARIELAAKELDHEGLNAIVKWKEIALAQERLRNPIYEPYPIHGGKKAPKEQWLIVTASGDKMPLYFRPNTAIDATFRVDGELLVMDETVLNWWSQWFDAWVKERENACRVARGGGRVCVLTEEIGAPISNSHLPKIRGKVFQSFGATFASAEADSFQSYGLGLQQASIPGTRKGADASYTNVSVRAAMAYCTALNHLLADEELHFDVGPVAVCFWGKDIPSAGAHLGRCLSAAYPAQVLEFLKAPFAGDVDREILRRDRLHSVALTGNAGRIVVLDWLEMALEEAISNFRVWWDDLDIVPFYAASKARGRTQTLKVSAPPPSPYAMLALARATVPPPRKNRKADRIVPERVVVLYRAALKRAVPPISLLKPILNELHAALVKDDDKRPTYPFTQSRFALVKLILIRNRKEGDFMPTPHLADTSDPAYNLGRLLAVFESLQDKYHNYKKEGAGIVERYYGRASSAPAAVFPLLCRLARHHLSKVRKEDEPAAVGIERRVTDVFSRFLPAEPGKPPVFPHILRLEEQGRFALGFYQQKADSAEAIRKAKEKDSDS